MMRTCGEYCMKMFDLNLQWKSRSEQTLGECRNWIQRLWEIHNKLENGGRRPRVFCDYKFHNYDLVREYLGSDWFTNENGGEFPHVQAAEYDHKFWQGFRVHRRVFMIINRDITDGKTGCFYFRKGSNAAGLRGHSVSMKLLHAFRQIVMLYYIVHVHTCYHVI